MKRATAKRLYDAQYACAEVETFTNNRTVDEMLEDRGLQLILHKLLEIIGEALNHVGKADGEVAAAIPDLRRFVNLRNQITHGYDTVDYAVIWQVATQRNPTLNITLYWLLVDATPVADG
jgi:uncharacterized protein with HEPN domain